MLFISYVVIAFVLRYIMSSLCLLLMVMGG